MQTYHRTYSYDPGTNLHQMSSSSGVTPRRMMVSSRSNRSIDEPLYSSLDLEQKLDLDASIETFFDVHGNQKQTGSPALMNRWDCSNQIQCTGQVAPDGSRTLEYSVYVVQGKRSRKILERYDAGGGLVYIQETDYLEELEYQTAWQGDNLVYDGEDVTDAESGEVVSPIEASHTLRIREGHRQVGERKVFTVKAGQAVDEAETLFSLDNRIDSCQARLDPSGELKSFLSYAPYGQTTQSFGETLDQRYRYSGQEEEDSGLYAYGFRSYLPSCYRWMSPDPAGMSGSGLNRYAMVDGNPVTMRDEMGLGRLELLIYGYDRKNFKTGIITSIQLMIQQYVTSTPEIYELSSPPVKMKWDEGRVNLISGFLRALNQSQDPAFRKVVKETLKFAASIHAYSFIILTRNTPWTLRSKPSVHDTSKMLIQVMSEIQSIPMHDKRMFAAPEFLYSNANRKKHLLSTEEHDEAVGHVKEISKRMEKMVIFPGTILHTAKDNKTAINRAYYLFNGDIVRYWDKHTVSTVDLGSQDPTQVVNSHEYDGAPHYSKELDRSIICQICKDHTDFKPGRGDMQVIISGSVGLHPDHLNISDHGLVVHADTFPYNFGLIQVNGRNIDRLSPDKTIQINKETKVKIFHHIG